MTSSTAACRTLFCVSRALSSKTRPSKSSSKSLTTLQIPRSHTCPSKYPARTRSKTPNSFPGTSSHKLLPSPSPDSTPSPSPHPASSLKPELCRSSRTSSCRCSFKRNNNRSKNSSRNNLKLPRKVTSGWKMESRTCRRAE